MGLRDDDNAQADWNVYMRRLIPANIAVAVIALIAAISLLFMPFFEIDVNKAVANSYESIDNYIDQGIIRIIGEDNVDMVEKDIDYSAMVSGEGTVGLNCITLLSYGTQGAPLKAILKDKLLFNTEDFEKAIVNLLNKAAMAYFFVKADDKESFNNNIDVEGLNDAVFYMQEEYGINGYENVLITYVAAGIIDTDKGVGILIEKMNFELGLDGDNFTVERYISKFLSDGNAADYDQTIDYFLSNGKDNSDWQNSGMNALMIISFIIVIAECIVWLAVCAQAVVHTLKSQKLFTKFYAVAICWIPCAVWLACIICGNSSLTGVVGALSSGMWLPAICYLLFVGIILLYINPLKSRMKNARQSPESQPTK
jgi:hypothetical protein